MYGSKLSFVENFLITKRKLVYWFSKSIFVLALLACIFIQPNYGVEFEGGYIVDVTATTSKDAQNYLDNNLRSVLVSTETHEAGQTIKLSGKTTSEQLDGFKAALGSSLLSVDSISGSYGSEMKTNSLIAVFSAMLAMTLYLAVRYNMYMAGATMFALFHDLVIAFGLVILFGIEINTMVVGAFMTIIGYSVNDSVVTLDKLKELIRKGVSNPINEAMSKVITRSMYTSKSTLIVVLSLLLLGGEAMRGFALIMTIGVVFGTLSSLIIVTTVLESMAKRTDKVFAITQKASTEGNV